MTSSTAPAPLSSNVGERSPPSSEHLRSFLQHWTYGGRGRGVALLQKARIPPNVKETKSSKTSVPHALYNVPRCLDNQAEKLPAVLLPIGDRSAIASTMIYSQMSTAWPVFSSVVPQNPLALNYLRSRRWFTEICFGCTCFPLMLSSRSVSCVTPLQIYDMFCMFLVAHWVNVVNGGRFFRRHRTPKMTHFPMPLAHQLAILS